MKNSIRRIFWLYFGLFSILILYLLKFTIVESKTIVTNSYNPRLTQIESNIKRGNILDRKGVILAENIDEEKGYTRKYNYPNQFAHIIGFIGNGNYGIESRYNFTLQKLDNEILQRIDNISSNTPLQGNNIVLTLDSEIQNYAYEKLGKSRGAIVVMEPSTGKIISMVSYPSFNPQNINSEWEKLKKDENSPLINRATQGLYPPGSVFKIITSACAIENLSNWRDITYECKGIAQFEESKIQCYNRDVHGKVNISSAMSVSCNTFFATIGTMLKGNTLKVTAENSFFNKPLDYPLEYNLSSFELDSFSSESELLQTSIGQGKTLISPLHMAMITSSVANNGIMMKPYVLDYIITYSGKEKDKTIPEKKAQIFSYDTSFEIKNMMESVVVSGTAIKAKIKGVSVAGKTGTAENASGDDHAWFVAFAPSDNPQIAVSVILENSGKGSKAIPIARDIIKFALEKNNN